MSYVVCGTATVAGKTLGETLSDEELATANVPALIEGGHIKPQSEEPAPNKRRAAAESE